MAKGHSKHEYSVVEWLNAPETDLHVARVSDAGATPPEAVTLRAVEGQPNVVCFRPEEFVGASSGRERFRRDAPELFIDGELLARIVLPGAESHDLEMLAQELGVSGDWSGAPGRTAVAAEVWRALLERLRKLPLPVLAELERLAAPTLSPLRPVIESAARAALKAGFGTRAKTLRDLIHARPPLSPRQEREPPREPPELLDIQEVTDTLGPGGPLARAFAGYEERPQQLRMAEEVSHAFNEGLVTLVEAGTGTGKSMAYLAPAVLWARRNNEPVIISTNTKNLQAQLFQKDLPFLAAALGIDFRYALIKGRQNYLCLRKFTNLIADADRELSAEERWAVMPTLTWLLATETGDVAENSGLRCGMQSELWTRMTTQPDECVGMRCRHARQCFVRKARALALQAHVVVANHATVFAEAGLDNVALPVYRRIIFDEAHNLEDVVTDSRTVKIAPWVLPRILGRLFRAQRDGAGRGYLSNLRFQLSRLPTLPGEFAAGTTGLVQKAIERFDELRRKSDDLFNAVSLVVGGAYGRGDRIRYDAEHRPDHWQSVAEAIIDLREEVEALAKGIEDLSDSAAAGAAAARGEPNLADLEDATVEVRFQAAKLREVVAGLNILLAADDANYVYWIEQGFGRNDTALCAAPLDITAMMNELVFSRNVTVVFTSATLTAGGRFDFMKDRLGVRGVVSDRVREVDLGTCFDFERQSLLAVPMFLPEPRPGGPDVIKPFCDMAIDLLRASRGRGLVLFTSHSALRASQDTIRRALARDGIRVMAQGVDGDRVRLVRIFARETSSVLLGTQSFWEGVDVPGESLSVLIVAKLPFRAHTDPIVSARCELLKGKGRNDFAEYMVPDAVIRLKQGFGRLIRTREDRGVVVMCDPRMMTKSYGHTFRRSLPVRARPFNDPRALAEAVTEFLGTP
jgi:predicted DnaQ family exonuclease/DinG family helicase